MWQGAAAVWHLQGDAADGAKVSDSSSGAHHGTASPAGMGPEPVTGIAAGGLHFDGVDDTVTVLDPIDGSLDPGAGSFTYSLWLRKEGPSAGLPFYKGALFLEDEGYDFEIADGFFSADLQDARTELAVVARMPFPVDAWTQVVVVIDRDADTIRLYLDGNLFDDTDATGFGPIDSFQDLALAPDGGFAGTIDEVRLHSRALSADEILAEHRNITDPASFVSVGVPE